jgi:hypothetical protein
MKRVEENGNWSLFCPMKRPDLLNVMVMSLSNSMKNTKPKAAPAKR